MYHTSPDIAQHSDTSTLVLDVDRFIDVGMNAFVVAESKMLELARSQASEVSLLKRAERAESELRLLTDRALETEHALRSLRKEHMSGLVATRLESSLKSTIRDKETAITELEGQISGLKQQLKHSHNAIQAEKLKVQAAETERRELERDFSTKLAAAKEKHGGGGISSSARPKKSSSSSSSSSWMDE